MLKLPISFCRYLKVTSENVGFRLRVRGFVHITCVGEPCCRLNTSINLHSKSALFYNVNQLQFFSSAKKQFRVKIPSLNSNVHKKNKQMSESLQPSVDHVSYGGQFRVSPSDNSKKWENQLDETGSAHHSGRNRCSIPSNFRIWEPVRWKSNSYDGGNVIKFKVLSYNVLAQYLLECHPYLYTDCAPVNLKWKVRAARLYEEIVNLNPDIVCLQEVQASHLDSFYSRFEQIGYSGIFKQKTGHRQDGCAIYFKRSIFEMKEHLSVEFYQPDLPILNRDNIGVVVKLVPRAMPAAALVVATTHLLYNPKRTDVRLAQLQLLLAEIDRFAYYNNGKNSGHLPIIMTGDLNSTPDSAVIKLLDSGHVSASSFRDSSDWKRIGVTDNCQHLMVYLDRLEGKNTDYSTTKIHNSDWGEGPGGLGVGQRPPSPPGCEHSELFNSGMLEHSLRLVSAYDKYKSDGSTEASTLQGYWLTVDYIYFSRCSSLKLRERLRLPTAEECSVLGTLPNDQLASDHLVLAAVFELSHPKASL